MAPKQSIKLIILGLIAISLVRCANQMSPPGGEVDTTPPYIIESYPENGTTNYTEQIIEFTFSEYVNKRNINEAFFISPLIEGLPEFSWTRKTVSIEFPDSLEKNTTYSVIIGTEITDFNNNNKMLQPYVLTFSTGSKLDSGKISGKVYAQKADGTLIFAYKTEIDTVNIYTNKPNYISQINAEGVYELNGLSDGEYLLFAVKDEFKDLVYNIGDDKIGLPKNNVILNSDSRNISGYDFFLTLEDTLAPNIQTVTMTDKNHIVVEFSEAIDSSRISVNNFTIFDSTSTKEYELKYWFKPNQKKQEYVLSFNDSLKMDNSLYLITRNIFDLNDNELKYHIIDFAVSDKPDTNIVEVLRIETPYQKSLIDYLSPKFLIYFSDGFDTTLSTKAISMFTRDSLEVQISFKYINNAALKILVNTELKPKANYSVSMDMNYFVDLAQNKIDTVISKRVVTVSDTDFSGVSGIVKSESEQVKIVLQDVNYRDIPKQANMSKSKKFIFDRIMPGEYLIWAYVDEDSSNSYSSGKVEPLEFAEDFAFYPDTLNLRARWPVGDIEIDLTNKIIKR